MRPELTTETPGHGNGDASPDILADFTTDHRVLLLSAMAVLIGAMGAAVAFALLRLINFVTNLAFYLHFSAAEATPRGNMLGGWVILVPVAGAVVVGLMARFGSDKIRGHGIPEALEAILLGGSRITLKVAVLKPLASAISIGTGGPFGAEGPIILTGGALGSLIAQQFSLTGAERKTLLAAGAAAGMSAVFATPVAAALLAVELLLFEWKPRSFIPVAVSSIVASVLRVPLLGASPLLPVALHTLASGQELLIAAGVGVLAGLASGGLTMLVYFFEDHFEKLPIHWMWWPALGAVGVGIGGFIDPRVLGVGYDSIGNLLRGELTGTAAIGLLVAKAFVWSIALGSGTSGGVLAPLLIMGGALGALVAQVLPAGDAGLWATIGMAAMMGGTMRSPLTAMVFAVELTHDFNLFPALFAGCIGSLAVTVLLMRRSILTEKLARRGQHIVREYSIDPLEIMRVGDVMDNRVATVPNTMTLEALADHLAAGNTALSRRQGTLIVDKNNHLAGIITRSDMARALGKQHSESLTVLQAGSAGNLVVTYPDESVQAALTKMLRHRIGRLPVISRQEPGRIVGYLGRASILAARQRAHEDEVVRQKR